VDSSVTARKQNRYLGTTVGATLALVYLLTFSGQLRSIDEFAMYARSESLARGHPDELDQLSFATQHNYVGSFEPGQGLAALPLYVIGRKVPGASSVATVMLLNVYVTAATGAVMFFLLRRLGYTPAVSAGTAMAWGIATTAWPYARSFFREPLNGFLWTSAALSVVAWSQTRRLRYAAFCALALLAGVAVKSSSAVAIPFFGLALLWDDNSNRLELSRKRLVVLATMSVLLIAFGVFLDQSSQARPLSYFWHKVWPYPFEQSLLRAYGALVSPLKGILFYSPILLATVPGWRKFLKGNRVVALIAVGASFSLFALYGTFTAWHGGHIVWGPRYYIPLLPLLLLPYASALSTDSRVTRAWVVAWTVISLVLQIAAGTAAWVHAVWPQASAYAGEDIIGIDGSPWYSLALWRHSPALVQLLDWDVSRLDLLWVRTLTDGSLVADWFLGICLLAASLVSMGCIVRVLVRGKCARGVPVLCLVLVLLSTSLVTVKSAQNTHDTWGLSRDLSRRLASSVDQPQQTSSVLLYVSNDFATYYWLGMLKGDYDTHWLSPHAEASDFARVTEKADQSDSIWVVVDRVHMPPDLDPYAARKALAATAYEVDAQWVDNFEVYRYKASREIARQPHAIVWENGLQLVSAGVQSPEVYRGDSVLIDLELSARPLVTKDYVLYVHLARVDGNDVIPGRDGEPHYGGAPTSTWGADDALVERRGILVPSSTIVGAYNIVVGWYDGEGVAVPLMDGALGASATEAIIGTIEVLPP
jgi:hypothetical protein